LLAGMGLSHFLVLENAPPEQRGPVLFDKPRSRGWLVAGGMIALLIVFSSLGVWLLVQRERRKDRSAAATSGQSPDANDKAPALLSLVCPECGKKLRTKAALAGKK